MATTLNSDIPIDLQILSETVRGAFAQKTAFVGSILVSSGALTIDGSMPQQGPKVIGSQITVPYFGNVGAFTDNPDGSSVTPVKIASATEVATIKRQSLAFEASLWSQAKVPGVDPYEEAANQIMVAAQRAIDQQVIEVAVGAGALSYSLYNASNPRTLQYSDLAIAQAVRWGDSSDGAVAAIMHSLAAADLATQTDSLGRPILVSAADGRLTTVMGLPVVVSDRMPLTGSTMSAVTSAGPTPPTVTLSGTPTGPWELQIDIVVGGTLGTATFRFSTDGGATWSATIATGASVALTDTAADSLVGNNGTTGITAAFAAGTYNADNLYTSKANIRARTVLCQRGSLAFWYNRAALTLQKDHNILNDVDTAAMHLYGCAHRYRRVRGGTKPGVLVIDHNVSTFAG